MAQKENKTVGNKRGGKRDLRVRWHPFKLLAWFAAMTLALGLLLAGVGYVIYKNLTESVNLVLAELVVGQQVKLGDISFPKSGLMRVDGLKVRDPDGEGHWLDVAEVEIEYDLDELKKHRRVKSLRLKRPVIVFDEGVMNGLKGTGIARGSRKSAPNINKGFDLGFLAKFTDEIRVQEGQAVIEWPGIPRMSFSFESDLIGLNSGGKQKKKWLSATPLKLSLREVQVGPKTSAVSADKVELEAMVSRDAMMIEVSRLEIVNPEVEVTPQWLADFENLPIQKSEEKEKTVSTSSGEKEVEKVGKKESLTVLFNKIGIRNGRFKLSGFNGEGSTKLLPEVAFAASVDWKGVEINGEGVQAKAPLSLMLVNVSVDGAMELEGEAALLGMEELEVSFLPQAVIKARRLEQLVIRKPELRLSTINMERLLKAKNANSSESVAPNLPKPQESKGERSEELASKAFRLGKVSIEGGRLFVENMDSKVLPDGEAGFSGEFRELVIGGEGGEVSSPEQQALRLSDVKVNGGELGGEDLFLTAANVDVDFNIDEVLQDGMVERLEISSPDLVVSDETLSRWIGGGEEEGVKGADLQSKKDVDELRASKSGEGDKKIWRIGDLKILEGSLATRMEKSIQGVPWMRGKFEVETLPFEFSTDKEKMREPRYRVNFSGVRVRPQTFVARKSDETDELKAGERGESSLRDAAFVRELSVEVTPIGLQKDKRIESVVVSGGEIKLNENFQALIGAKDENLKGNSDNKSKKTPPDILDAKKEEPSVKAEEDSGWRIGELGVNRTIVRLEAMIPQLQGIQFSIETSMKDVPLTAEGLASRHQIQQVEIAGIELRDPYEGMRTAAILPTIFLKFSLGGLMKQELESVDILGPVLYVGEPLFNWIDYQRKYRQLNEGTSLGPEEGAEGADKAGGVEAKKEGNWKLKKIKAHYGKMVIAPIGAPIGIVPFPFEVETNLEDGQIALNLKIPEEQYVYTLPDLKLDLYGLSGEVQFNVPIKDKNNNIWQYFELDRLVWKQFNAEKISVSVTYDSNGIYGKVGGKAYDGYVNGEFNVYLKDLGKWDGWLAVTNVNMGPITQAIAPENFLMDGTISGKLVSRGNGLILGPTTGELQSVTPGRIEITKLDSVLEALPEDWTQLKLSLTEMALNGLKTFDYEKAQGKIDMVRRDGEITLDLRGPAGSRVFHFYLHDWRKKKESVVSSQ